MISHQVDKCTQSQFRGCLLIIIIIHLIPTTVFLAYPKCMFSSSAHSIHLKFEVSAASAQETLPLGHVCAPSESLQDLKQFKVSSTTFRFDLIHLQIILAENCQVGYRCNNVKECVCKAFCNITSNWILHTIYKKQAASGASSFIASSMEVGYMLH